MRVVLRVRGVFTPPVTKRERVRRSVWHSVAIAHQILLYGAFKLIYKLVAIQTRHQGTTASRTLASETVVPTPVRIRRNMSRLRSRLFFGDHSGGGIPDNGQGNPSKLEQLLHHSNGPKDAEDTDEVPLCVPTLNRLNTS